MVAVNYVGEELWSFYNAPWEKRVDLARQLMDIAEQLTNNDFEFALYLLDVSFDNFAVGPRDGKVIIVDAENVLVADKRLIKQSKFCPLQKHHILLFKYISFTEPWFRLFFSFFFVYRRQIWPCCAGNQQNLSNFATKIRRPFKRNWPCEFLMNRT